MNRNKWLVLVTFILILGLFTLVDTFCDQKKIALKEFYKEIELFADAISVIRLHYVDDVDAKEIIYGALEGMLSSLDDYSQFMEPVDYKEMKEETKGEFGGLGIQIGIRDKMLTVIAPISGTPADKAGLKPRDIIVKIDNEPTKHITIDKAVKKLRGKPGTKVNLTIWREEEEKFIEVEITRAIIEVKSVRKNIVLDGDIGYIKLVEFQENTPKEIEAAMKEFMKNEVKGVILDLRNNAGGLLSSAVGVSDLFLKKGDMIVSTKGRIESQNKEFKSTKNTPFNEITMVVLVNEGSASASEIVAGAIKDNTRGILVGKNTFGKGSVQTVLPLRDGSALRITTAEYFTPSNVSIRKKGIPPDVDVKLEIFGDENDKDLFEQLKEEGKDGRDILEKDSQIKAAMDMIKAVNIYREQSGVKG